MECTFCECLHGDKASPGGSSPSCPLDSGPSWCLKDIALPSSQGLVAGDGGGCEGVLCNLQCTLNNEGDECKATGSFMAPSSVVTAMAIYHD